MRGPRADAPWQDRARDAQHPRPGRRRPAQARRRRPRVRGGPGPRLARRAHGRLDGRRGAAPHPHLRPRDLLEPVPRRVLAQGRHLGECPVGAARAHRLRRRRAARRGRAGGRGLPHGGPRMLRRGRGPAGRRRGDGMTAPGTPPSAADGDRRPLDLPWGATWPTLDGFRRLATDRRVIPVVRRLLADGVTPVGLYRTLARGRPGTFVLESAEVDGTWARYSFVGAAARATLTARGGEAVWLGDVPVGVPTGGDVL